jgi:hypothetical protein
MPMMGIRLAKGTSSMGTFERSWEDLGYFVQPPSRSYFFALLFLVLLLTADVGASGDVPLASFATRLVELLVVLPSV